MKLQNRTLFLIASVLNSAGITASAEEVPQQLAQPTTRTQAATPEILVAREWLGRPVPTGYEVATFKVRVPAHLEPTGRVDVLWSSDDKGGDFVPIVKGAKLLTSNPMNPADGIASENKYVSTVSLQLTSEDSAKLRIALTKGSIALQSSVVTPSTNSCPGCGMGGWGRLGFSGESVGRVEIGGYTYEVAPDGRLRIVDK